MLRRFSNKIEHKNYFYLFVDVNEDDLVELQLDADINTFKEESRVSLLILCLVIFLQTLNAFILVISMGIQIPGYPNPEYLPESEITCPSTRI